MGLSLGLVGMDAGGAMAGLPRARFPLSARLDSGLPGPGALRVLPALACRASPFRAVALAGYA